MICAQRPNQDVRQVPPLVLMTKVQNRQVFLNLRIVTNPAEQHCFLLLPAAQT